MAASTGNGSGNGARSGAQTLLLLATPLNCLILRALSEGPKQQAELRRETGSPAQTTLRAQLKRLSEIGTIDKHRRNRFPGVLEYSLTRQGRDLLFVIDVLERWLAIGPEGPLELGSSAAKAAIKALAEGWSTTMLRVLAVRPLSLTNLDRVIADLNYPSLERRLGAMRLVSLVEPRPTSSRGVPYGVTLWLRQAVAPLVAATRWERWNLADHTTAPSSLDVEAAFLLAVPMLQLPAELSASCRLTVEIPSDGGRRLAGVLAEIDAGRIKSCTSKLQGNSTAWATGSLTAWFEAVIEADGARLELGGDYGAVREMVEGLHDMLFRTPAAELNLPRPV